MNNKVPKLSITFDFDELSTLAAGDPEAFETVRSALICQAIYSMANSDQLLELQMRLDEYGINGSDVCFSYFLFSNWLQDSYAKLSQQIERSRSLNDSMTECLRAQRSPATV